MKVMIVVTHLLGTGHLARALTLARAMVQAGHTALVVSGGMPTPHLRHDDIELIQLPPLRSDGTDFYRLLDDADQPVSNDMMAQRQAQLIHHLTTFQPDLLITELFPFGRRNLRHEFLALLEAAAALPDRPLICASVRDILAPPTTTKKEKFAEDQVARFYDAILVHSDPAVTPLTLSWPLTAPMLEKVHYTGFVAPPAPLESDLGRGEVIVSVGGGNVGEALLKHSVSAAAADPVRRWRILVGGGQADARIEVLRAEAPPNAVVEPARPDFRNMLHLAAASVSLCGYNTALDVLQTGCPAVFVPFDAGGEVEQTLRATALAELDGIALISNENLTPDTLLHAIGSVQSAPKRPVSTEGFEGGPRTVDVLATLLLGAS